MKEYSLDPERVWNVDESGAKPVRYAHGSGRHRRFLHRKSVTDVRLAEFSFSKRITLKPHVSAAGSIATTLFEYHGKKVPYLEVLKHGKIFVETLSDCLPRASLLYAGKMGLMLISDALLSWAKRFAEHVKDLTAGGRKVLLTLDVYRSHMGVKSMCHFEERGVLCYAIPSHTSGKTQPAGVCLFGSFKQQLNSAIFWL